MFPSSFMTDDRGEDEQTTGWAGKEEGNNGNTNELGYPEDMNTTTKNRTKLNLGVINAASRRLHFRKLLVVNLTSLSFAETDSPSEEVEDNSYIITIFIIR